MNAIQKLRQLHADIAASKDGLKIVDAWSTVARLLPRATTNQAEAARVIKSKDAAGLLALIDEIERPPVAPAQPAHATDQEMKDAMHAFRKRLKLARLDDESRLGSRYTTGGRHSRIDAIEPPRDFPKRVWDALVQAGRLVDTGKGFYADAEEAQ